MSKTLKRDFRAFHHCSCPDCCREPDGTVAREHRAINRIIACTDERSRRLVAGFLARLYGHGGITLLARVTGLDRNTIARGRRELDQDDTLPSGRVRRPGGGPKRVEVRFPES
ncbi:MAG: hypothetical protein JO034_29380 [Singulisphaera sp.]|nr:hypothetical protein [Planctomycetaceae bacterium]MBV8611543.1 hypothetical protein [Singulisphaera sp.]